MAEAKIKEKVVTVKAAEVKPAAEPVKAEVKTEAKTEKAEVKKETAAKKAPAKKAAAKPAAKKETAAKKAPAAKKEPAAKKAPAKKAAVKEVVNLQFSGKSYTTEELVKIAKDVWEYDLKQKAADFKTVELYVKPEEGIVYYVVNKEITGSFFI